MSAQLDRAVIEASLKSKGFEAVPKRDHRVYHHKYKGKDTGAWTKISTGGKYKVYGITLIKHMKKQLFLENNNETINLLDCTLSGKEYVELLKEKGHL